MPTLLVSGSAHEVVRVQRLDNASFALNNELNVTFLDRRLARRLTEIFERDLTSTTAVNLDEWRRHVLRHLLYLPLIPLRDQL